MTRQPARGQVSPARTRRAAVVVGVVAALVLAAGVRLWWATYRLVHSEHYLPGVYNGPYAAGAMEPDGYGIYLPSGLLVGLGLVLARFACNLWQDRLPGAARGANGTPGGPGGPQRTGPSRRQSR